MFTYSPSLPTLTVQSKAESKVDSKESKDGYQATSLEKLSADFESYKKQANLERKQKANVRDCFKHWKYKTQNTCYKQLELGFMFGGFFKKYSKSFTGTLTELFLKFDDYLSISKNFILDELMRIRCKTILQEMKKKGDLNVQFGKLLIIMGKDRIEAFNSVYYEDYPELLEKYSEPERLELAKIDVCYHGMKALEKYHFSEEQNKQVIAYAENSLKNTLINVSPEMIETYVNQNNREGLYYLIYQRFSGQFHFDRFSAPESVQKLQTAVIDFSSTELDAIANIFKQAMRDQEKYFLKAGWKNMPRKTDKRREYWGKNLGKQPTDETNFSHGGGYFHILEYLTGHSDGYQLEPNSTYYARGLQVTPGVSAPGDRRDEHYAKNRMDRKWHFDHPARLFAKIPVKYLDRADDNNDYEAGLRPEFIDHIQNVCITKF